MSEGSLPAAGSWKGPSLALAAAAVALGLIYLPDIGHGFIRDDFMWLRVARIHSLEDLTRMLGGNVGFYRPLVSASFAIDHALFGLTPLAYGLTNLLLLLLGAALLARLASTLGLRPAAAAAAAVIWALNFHAVSMALLWLSGRTALLLCVFGLLMAHATIRGHRWRAAIWCALALLSKEEAVALPFAMAAWAWFDSAETAPAGRATRAAAQAWPLFAALLLYLPLRYYAGAFGPSTAPSYYQFTASPLLLARNVGEYADRACTLSAAVVLVMLAIARRRPALDAPSRNALTFGALWLIAGYAITVLLPIRSDLYALNPSIGAALGAGAVVHALLALAPARTERTLAALLAVAFLLIPVYRIRNARWVRPADLSSRVIADLQHATGAIPDGAHVVLVDDPQAPVTLASAFSGLLPDAAAVMIGRGVTAELVDTPADIPGASPSGPPVVYRLRQGHLARMGVPRQ